MPVRVGLAFCHCAEQGLGGFMGAIALLITTPVHLCIDHESTAASNGVSNGS